MSLENIWRSKWWPAACWWHNMPCWDKLLPIRFGKSPNKKYTHIWCWTHLKNRHWSRVHVWWLRAMDTFNLNGKAQPHAGRQTIRCFSRKKCHVGSFHQKNISAQMLWLDRTVIFRYAILSHSTWFIQGRLIILEFFGRARKEIFGSTLHTV